MGRSEEEERPTYFPLVFLVGALSISFASILIKLCREVPSLVISAYRTSLVSLFLLPWFFLNARRPTPKQVLLCLASGTGLAFHFAFWIGSLKYTTVASSLFILSIYPFITALLARMFLGERVPANFLAGSILALAGIGIIFSLDLSSIALTKGNLLSLLGALAFSLYFLPGRVARRQLGLVEYLFIVYGWASLLLVTASLLSGMKFTGYSPNSYVYLFLLAALSQGLGHSSFNWALRYVKTGLVALTTLVEPIGATLLAWLLLREGVGPAKMAGMALVAAGIFLAWIKE